MLDPLTVVPVDIYIEDEYFIIVITGPQHGRQDGRLKTRGLLDADGAGRACDSGWRRLAVSVFEQVFADIGDEQSIEQSLSTFSSHMTNIVEILAEADTTPSCCWMRWARGRTRRKARRWRRRY